MPVIHTLFPIIAKLRWFPTSVPPPEKSTDLNVNESAKTGIKSLFDLPHTRGQTIQIHKTFRIYLRMSLFRAEKQLKTT